MRRLSLVIVLAWASAVPATAADPQAYACSFNVGTARSFDKGRFKPDRPGRVVFDITAIAVDQQTATAKRGETGSVLRVVRAVNALHFLEVVGEGYMNITTVYDRDPKATKHAAVHSRHFGVLGQPIFSQYFGFCSSS